MHRQVTIHSSSSPPSPPPTARQRPLHIRYCTLHGRGHMAWSAAFTPNVSGPRTSLVSKLRFCRQVLCLSAWD